MHDISNYSSFICTFESGREEEKKRKGREKNTKI